MMDDWNWWELFGGIGIGLCLYLGYLCFMWWKKER